MSRVLVTGATGFVGRHLCSYLAERLHDVVGVVRKLPSSPWIPACELREVGGIDGDTDWRSIRGDIDYVVHLAARVHVMKDRELDPLAAFRKVNVEGTKRLLSAEMIRKAKRFVYVSTVKIHGDATNESPFRASDNPVPEDPYAQSKLEAECIVEELGAQFGVETVIVRPPLVYGPGVGGNFLRLMQLIDKGCPLPFGSIKNKRSLLGVENLCSVIQICLDSEAAAGSKFLVSDNHDLSTAELVLLIADTMSRPARLLPVPTAALGFAARLVGRSAEVSRLTGSLQVAIDETIESLAWLPPISAKAGIRSTVNWYLERNTDAKQ